MIGETIEEIEEMRGKEETDEMDAMMTGRREEIEEMMRGSGKIGMTEKREGKRKRRRTKRKRTMRRKRSQSMPGTQKCRLRNCERS